MRARWAATSYGSRFARSLRRALVVTALCAVVLGVIGMHQLSLGHHLGTPSLAVEMEHGGEGSHLHPGQGEQPVLDVSVPAAATWSGSSSGDGDGCPGCGDHRTAVSVCLLATTLVVLTWLLTPPGVRPFPPRWRSRPATPIVLRGRPLRALSRSELSILRT
ncbi:MAG: hypothetical protein JWP61_1826 [Friedmanniella sp.]|nr:hypothetical protein [Friedmanniella sp.]